MKSVLLVLLVAFVISSAVYRLTGIFTRYGNLQDTNSSKTSKSTTRIGNPDTSGLVDNNTSMGRSADGRVFEDLLMQENGLLESKMVNENGKDSVSSRSQLTNVSFNSAYKRKLTGQLTLVSSSYASIQLTNVSYETNPELIL